MEVGDFDFFRPSRSLVEIIRLPGLKLGPDRVSGQTISDANTSFSGMLYTCECTLGFAALRESACAFGCVMQSKPSFSSNTFGEFMMLRIGLLCSKIMGISVTFHGGDDINWE